MEVVDKSHLLVDNPIDLSYGVTIQDFDGDGVLEIFVGTQSGPNHLFKRMGDGFVEITPRGLKDENCSALGVAAADVTGNGLPDLYVMNSNTFAGAITEPDRLYLNLGNLQFHDLMVNHPDRNIAAGRSVAFTDPVGAGDVGLYVANYGAPNKLFVSNGKGYFRNEAPVGHGLGVIVGGRAVVSQDLFNSGRMDIVVLNEGGPNLVFRNLEDAFEECAEELGLDDPEGNGRGIAVCDFDRDGMIDLVYCNWEGEHRIMRQLNEGGFVDVAPPHFAEPSRARNIIVADFDNDGWEDIFLNNMGEPNRLFFNNRDGTFREVDPGPMRLADGTGTGASCGDLDGDGMLEIYICHGESMAQRNRMFSLAKNENHWIRIQPLTPVGAPAIGARVELHFPRPMTRFIDGGSGYLCQMEPVAHFGLGSSTRVPTAYVRWTDGAEVYVNNLEADQFVQIAHPVTDET
ncbi:MAG TPA: CRTAC1 family protein [Fimbriimonadaceae bacterium]|nr:CRTAC1 family protein [Fimbriimonadaceae bacterium]